MSLLHDAWVALRHGGNLLAPDALDGLPKPSKAPLGLADRLRSALVDLDPDKPGKVIGPLVEMPFGRWTYATDPDGNSIGLFEAKG